MASPTNSLPTYSSHSTRGGPLDDELSLAESFLANLRSNLTSEPEPPSKFQSQSMDDQHHHESDMLYAQAKQRFTPRINSREGVRQAIAASQQSSRANSRGSHKQGLDDDKEEEEEEDNLTARAKRWSTAERNDGWKWSGRPSHRDALGNVVLKQAEQGIFTE
jgi:hypothetical protein